MENNKTEESFIDRLRNEAIDLDGKIDKLNDFLQSEKFNTIDSIQQSLLYVQESAMKTYIRCLLERMAHLDTVTCECGKETKLAEAHIDQDGTWTCKECYDSIMSEEDGE